MTLLDDAANRFWARVSVGAPEDCWPWKQAGDRDGYGTVKFEPFRDWRAHRVAWLLTYGEEPSEWVCHNCDNPPCCNPDHLYEGTAFDNNHDTIRRGRTNWAKGERSGQAKLTEAEVLEIKQRVKEGFPYWALGEVYGVHPNHIGYIIQGRKWRYLMENEQ